MPGLSAGGEESLPHPFRREGLGLRVLPFAAVSLLGLSAIFVLFADSRRSIAVAGVVNLLIVATVLGLPWRRLPRWLALVPPFVYMLGIVWLQRVTPLRPTTFAPFLLLPLFWLALHGSRGELLGGFGFLALGLLLAGIGRPRPEGELLFRTLAYGASLVVCFVAQTLVFEQRRSARALRALLDALPIGVTVSRDGIVRYANPTLVRMLGHDRADELVGRSWLALVREDRREALSERGRGPAPTELIKRQDVPLVRADGGELLVELAAVPVEAGARSDVVDVMRDVSDERWLEAAQQELRETIATERARQQVVLACIEDGVALLDAERNLVYANRAYTEMFALDPAKVVGMSRAAFVAHVAQLSHQPEALAARMAALTMEPGLTREELALDLPRPRLLKRTVKPTGTGFLVIWQDRTVERELLAARERLALIDPVTEISNRRGLERALAREVDRLQRAQARGEEAALTLVMFDIDHFKQINDERGHAAGDETLRRIAAVLSAETRAIDTVGRWGGDEFVAVVIGPKEAGQHYAERVRAAVAATVTGATLSAGVAQVAVGEDWGQALARADANLYRSKTAGRDRITA